MTALNPVNHARSRRWIGPGLFALAVITRLPFASHYLYHWDSVNMAFGILHYDVRGGAPQFPGYIVYIVLAQIVNVLVNDPQSTMVLISLASTGLAAVTMYALGRRMFRPATGLIASLFLISSPLFWFYGEIALPHALDLFVVTLAAWLLYHILIGSMRWLWPTVVYLALVGGFRQQDLLFLAPLIVFACWRIGFWRIAAAFVLGGLVTLTWFLPLMALTGGMRAYLDGSAAFSASFFASTSLLDGAGAFGLKRNLLNKLIPYTLYAWSAAALPALYWLPQIPAHGTGWLCSRKAWFLALWIMPAAAFYTLIHMGQQGLVFVFFPALVLISAEGLYRLCQPRPVLLRTAVALIVMFGAAVFITVPTYPLGSDSFKLLTYDTLRQHDHLLENQMTTVNANFDPAHTLLLAENWRFFQYYLPDYTLARFTLGAKFERDQGQVGEADYVNRPVSAAELGLAAGQNWQIVIMDDDLIPFAGDPTALRYVTRSGSDYKLAYLLMKPDMRYVTDGSTYGSTP